MLPYTLTDLVLKKRTDEDQPTHVVRTKANLRLVPSDYSGLPSVNLKNYSDEIVS